MKKAFTLVELMIVVAILGILAAIVIPGVQAHSSDARESAAKDNLRALRGQIEMYKMQHNNVQPGYVNGSATTAATTVNQFKFCSKPDGTASPLKTPTATYSCGPYILDMPDNPWNGLATFSIVPNATAFSTAADGTSSGWLYKIETGEIRCNSTGTDDSGVNHYDY